MGESRVAKVLAFLEATESTCAATDVIATGCAASIATINVLLLDCAELLAAFAALELVEATAHKLAAE